MNLEWSDEALADLDRFVEFLGQGRPSLAKIVATEIIDKVQVLAEHPQLGRLLVERRGVVFVMSASIIWPVAAGHRLLFRVHRIMALGLFPALVLLLYASVLAASETPSKPFLEKNSFYLSSAGFRVQVANNSAGQKALRTLPAHRFVANGVGDELRYLYAEPQHCVCIFVGTQQAYDRYRQILSQPLKPADNVPPDYKTQAGMLLSNQPLRQSTRGDPTTLSDYLSTLRY